MRFRVSQLESAASPRATLVGRRLSSHGSALTTRRLSTTCPCLDRRILLLQLSRKQNPTSGTPASSCPTARARGPEPRPARRPLFAEELSALACTWVLAPAVGACSRNNVVSLGSVRLWASTSVGDPADLTRFRVSRAVRPRAKPNQFHGSAVQIIDGLSNHLGRNRRLRKARAPATGTARWRLPPARNTLGYLKEGCPKDPNCIPG